MCARYTPPRWDEFHKVHRALPPENLPVGPVFPRGRGAFIRRVPLAPEPDSPEVERELVVGQWALIPSFAKAARLPYSTNNARWEGVPTAASYRQPWARGQRCIIPAQEFFEPNWETGRNRWWGFRRVDGRPFGLAGLWNTWMDPASGEVVESYTMLTVNADAHPLMSRMHKPDPRLGPDQQDKRSVVVVEPADWDLWLAGEPRDAAELVRLSSEEVFEHGPEDAAPVATLFD
jgi:putative SOS response-associated peptidase YedK